ncbi:TerD family protein [Caldimonas brevitalea]|uniref:Chemical-damaging agent resistance protein C n=1 Tax=Caldimonas brevitalea TaxID=413882 RepID=A0A0G3BQC9_9BURK|nr:TerD family protein [Caldimonas brevitalea]AKJ30188.1 chemical-damaging agent resistance protein C [Caldimonas brevitalea]
MTINLKKGGSLNLTKAEPALTRVRVGLGWELPQTTPPLDLDVSAFVCRLNAQQEPKLLSEQHFVFYNNKATPNGAVVHSGDNRTGAGEGDDENMVIDLPKLEPEVREISFVVTLHEAAERRQHFGMLKDAYIRIYNEQTGKVLCTYDLDEQFSRETAVQMGSVVRTGDGQWEFRAVGAGYTLDLGTFVSGYLG